MTEDRERAVSGTRRTAGAFDVRLVIAALFAVYGVVLAVLGAVADPQQMAKSAGLNVNLWVGVGMLVFAALFGLWVWTRPIVLPPDAGETSEQRST